MSSQSPQLLVTGATGQLGRLVIDHLLEVVPSERIVAMARREEAAGRHAARNVRTVIADYDQPDMLDAAVAGIDRVLLISSNDLARRVAQHRNVIDAARRARVGLLAYTSILHADASPLALAAAHRDTEDALRASGVPFVLLRNGWYSENYAARIPAALAHHGLLGSAGAGKIASAARADYAAAAAAVLASPEAWESRVLELAGDLSYTLSEFAAEISRQSGQQVGYKDLPEAEYEAALLGAGLPQGLAAVLANSDAGASRGALFDDARQLSRLIGRPTTPMATTVAQTLTAA